MSNDRTRKAIDACRDRCDRYRRIQLFAVRHVIETKSRGISGVDDIDPDLKLTLDAWELKLFEFNYREALLIRYIVGELGGDADEAREYIDDNMPACGLNKLLQAGKESDDE